MASPEDAVRARRRLTNKLIAARDAARLKPFFDPDVKLIVGAGDLIVGSDAVIQAFASQFAAPMLARYERTPEVVEPDRAGDRAAEQGRWTGSWTQAGGRVGQSGRYLAVWKAVRGQWVIESELYVSLTPVEPLAG
jgi:ketosteroid isomerase-like protein